jgi:hypothetical protein
MNLKIFISLVNSSKRHPSLVRRRIELPLLPNQIGHLIGRKGHQHKSIMEETKTRIHFDNIPYSISSREQVPDFDLDLFQSSCTIRATITGHTLESVENATKQLEEHVRVIQVCKIYLRKEHSQLSDTDQVNNLSLNGAQ